MNDLGTWLEPGRLLASAYPRGDAALATLADQGISLLINLHEQPHDARRLARHSIAQLHLPVEDFAVPTEEQLDQGVAAIRQALAAGKSVAVHCGAGLGRTGTLLACYLVRSGLSPDQAITQIRQARPGSIETAAQEAAVAGFSRRLPPAAAAN